MRRLSVAGLVAGLALVSIGGCCTPCASTGWRFEVGRPATFNSPGLVQQTSGQMEVSPLGTTIPPLITGTAARAGAVQLMPASPAIETIPQPRRMIAPPATQDCTCEQLLQLLQRIDARLSALGSKKLAPGPELEE